MSKTVLSLPIGPYLASERAGEVAQIVLRAAGVPVPASSDPALTLS
jgi:hypothetical protein